MIEIRITNEIGSYEPKFIGPFTLRQVICLAVGAFFCYAIYIVTFPYLPFDVAGFLCCIPAAIAVLFGWVKPYGMRMEKFIKSVAVNILLAPTHRRYKTKNTHEQLLHALEEQQANEVAAKADKPAPSQKDKKVKITKTSAPEYYL